jgi:hypothetical protein
MTFIPVRGLFEAFIYFDIFSQDYITILMIMCLDSTLIMDKKTEIQSAVFERLVNHLQNESDVQNIDMMILAGFCRNCLSRWYQEESEKIEEEISPDEAREIVYGMPYQKWKELHQKPASQEQLDLMNARKDK